MLGTLGILACKICCRAQKVSRECTSTNPAPQQQQTNTINVCIRLYVVSFYTDTGENLACFRSAVVSVWLVNHIHLSSWLWVGFFFFFWGGGGIFFTCKYIYRKIKLSVTPGHRTVQEGLSMVSCREGMTKSKHVLFWKLFTPKFRPWGLCQGLPGRFDWFLLRIFSLEGFAKACPVGLTDS